VLSDRLRIINSQMRNQSNVLWPRRSHQKGVTIMTKQLVLGILAVLILGAAPALASDTTNREEQGGSKIGPLGQCFDARACYGGYYGGYPGGGYYAYGSVLPPRYYGSPPRYNPNLDYY
jgi:uncharacterized membrane protein